MERVQEYFSFYKNKKRYVVEFEDIIYFECCSKKIRVVTIDDVIEYYGNFKDLRQQLPMDLFWVVHSSFAINVNYVKCYKSDSVLLETGKVIYVSRKYKKEYNQKLSLRIQS